MRTSWLIVLVGLALPSAAQATSVNAIRLLELAAEEDHARAPSVWDTTSAWSTGARMPFQFEPAAMDHVNATLREEASPVARESLERTGEPTVPFNSAPGGIVLGLVATPDQEAWKGARLEYEAPSSLWLRRADGQRFELPAIDRTSLASFLTFTSAGASDTLIDIYGDNLRLAPAFADTGLAWRLERADRAPRQSIPGPGDYKSLIVDRAVGFAAVRETIVLRADVEIRFYTKKDSWLLPDALHRVGTWPFLDGETGLQPLVPLPRGTDLDALRPCMQDVSRIAGWLGFLRWAELHDPAGVADLRRALQSGKVSVSQD